MVVVALSGAIAVVVSLSLRRDTEHLRRLFLARSCLGNHRLHLGLGVDSRPNLLQHADALLAAKFDLFVSRAPAINRLIEERRHSAPIAVGHLKQVVGFGAEFELAS